MANRQMQLLVQLLVLLCCYQRLEAEAVGGQGLDAEDVANLLFALLGVRLTARHIRRLAAGLGTPFRRPSGPGTLTLDAALLLFATSHGWNYGIRFAYGAVRRAFPELRATFAAVREAWARLNPAAYRIRFTGAVRRLVRQGAFIAPFFCALWQSDLNCVLQDWGIVHAIVYDVCTHSVLVLVPLDCRLTAVVWEEANRVAALAYGLPDLWTTDKGGETAVTAFAQRVVAAGAAGGGLVPRAHRYLRSSRQSGVERFNGEINVKVNLPLKLVFIYMETVLNVLDRTVPEHMGAIQALVVMVLQQADNQLLDMWDMHMVRSARRNLGVPSALRRDHPHPGPQRTLPAGVDWVARYEAATGRRYRRVPVQRAARDPLTGNPRRQAVRLAAVQQVLGPMVLAWADVCHNTGRDRFIPAYLLYLSFR